MFPLEKNPFLFLKELTKILIFIKYQKNYWNVSTMELKGVSDKQGVQVSRRSRKKVGKVIVGRNGRKKVGKRIKIGRKSENGRKNVLGSLSIMS